MYVGIKLDTHLKCILAHMVLKYISDKNQIPSLVYFSTQGTFKNTPPQFIYSSADLYSFVQP